MRTASSSSRSWNGASALRSRPVSLGEEQWRPRHLGRSDVAPALRSRVLGQRESRVAPCQQVGREIIDEAVTLSQRPRRLPSLRQYLRLEPPCQETDLDPWIAGLAVCPLGYVSPRYPTCDSAAVGVAIPASVPLQPSVAMHRPLRVTTADISYGLRLGRMLSSWVMQAQAAADRQQLAMHMEYRLADPADSSWTDWPSATSSNTSTPAPLAAPAARVTSIST